MRCGEQVLLAITPGANLEERQAGLQQNKFEGCRRALWLVTHSQEVCQ